MKVKSLPERSIKLFFLFFLICLSHLSYSQNNQMEDSLFHNGICDRNGFCLPSIEGLPRPKGIQITQNRNLNYSIETTIRDSTTIDKSEIKNDRKWEFKVKFPVISKPQFKLVVGLQYSVEEFKFEQPDKLTNEFQKKLENKPLRSIRNTFYLLKPFKGNKYLLGRTGVSLNGDFVDRELNSYFKWFAAGIYGIKASSTKTWGFGLSYSYSLGNWAVYPLLAYNKQFDNKLGVELLLPVSVKLRYIPNEKNVFYFNNKLEGDNYNLEFDNLPNNNLFLGKSSFRSFITYEREVHDFLWFTISAGISENINFDLSSRDEFVSNNTPYINNELGTAPFLEAGIFVVPPRSWLKKK